MKSSILKKILASVMASVLVSSTFMPVTAMAANNNSTGWNFWGNMFGNWFEPEEPVITLV